MRVKSVTLWWLERNRWLTSLSRLTVDKMQGRLRCWQVESRRLCV